MSVKQTLEKRGFVAYKLQTQETDAVGELVAVESRLSGIADLMLASDFSTFTPESMYGVGCILEDLTSTVAQIRNHLDATAVGKGKRPEKRGKRRAGRR